MVFQFKQFAVAHDKCAMKVGTDGVLLGAWAMIDSDPFLVLDIGSGSGVIALMLAQRSNSEQIDAIEIDDEAYEQCVDNFENSPWGDRLFCYHAAFDEFVEEMEEQYDLIVSNPPFFEPIESDLNNPELNSRSTARFYDALPFDELIEGVAKLLTDEGLFCVIIPYAEEEKFIQLAQEQLLFPKKITRVRGTQNSDIKRSLLAFSREKNQNIKPNELVIEIERHVYTPEYTDLVKDFYLKL